MTLNHNFGCFSGVVFGIAGNVELDAKIEVYWRAYIEQQKLFYEAFVHKNHLGVERNDDSPRKELTDEERAQIFKVMQMANGMERTNVHKQLKS